MPLVYSIDCNTASRLLLSCSPEIRFLNTCPKSKIPDLQHYQNFYEFPIKLLNYLVIICFDP